MGSQVTHITYMRGVGMREVKESQQHTKATEGIRYLT